MNHISDIRCIIYVPRGVIIKSLTIVYKFLLNASCITMVKLKHSLVLPIKAFDIHDMSLYFINVPLSRYCLVLEIHPYAHPKNHPTD